MLFSSSISQDMLNIAWSDELPAANFCSYKLFADCSSGKINNTIIISYSSKTTKIETIHTVQVVSTYQQSQMLYLQN